MKKIYYLSTCDTCRRIIDLLDFPSDIIFQDIKSEPISVSQLEKMQELAGSYEALFSKRARLYKERDLKSKTLSEEDYKNLILEHYTFLKRPVIINENRIFIGNSAKVVEAAKGSFHE
ncbi:arsenate reductase family protein [Galbibacter sp.]|jgi:arsenate reductase|uniref:arsenate reductase family protein n=1 Tax=Galbibacter sp. TaxID=2918471 RepID=UPI003A90DAEB